MEGATPQLELQRAVPLCLNQDKMLGPLRHKVVVQAVNVTSVEMKVINLLIVGERVGVKESNYLWKNVKKKKWRHKKMIIQIMMRKMTRP